MSAREIDDRGAIFSPCTKYRYRLWRRWHEEGPSIAFCMLNPSTADERANDPTVERCEQRARMWGYAQLIVVNLFAWRSTDPRGLREPADPVGPDNLAHIVQAVKDSTMLVCGWGTHGKYLGMGPMIVQRLKDYYPGRAHALRVNADGSPCHPLYLPYSLAPTPL